MQTSKAGIAFVERHEGVVTQAYRDPVGVWTIGAGLTKASGVVAPKAGMTISSTEASKLLGEALARNYEPTVTRAMPGAKQHEFDGGVSFHFNTGAIGRASWVQSWLARDWPEVRRRLALWRKAGGKVLPGLERRREEEGELIQFGSYGGSAVSLPSADPAMAPFVIPMTADAVVAARAGFRTLGYEPGEDTAGLLQTSVVAFQRDHDLVQDGLVGRATLSTLQRMLDARTKVAAPVATAGAGATVEATDLPNAAPDLASLPDWLGWAVIGLGLLWLAWRLWSYRDAIAARIQSFAPRLAKTLRSI